MKLFKLLSIVIGLSFFINIGAAGMDPDADYFLGNETILDDTDFMKFAKRMGIDQFTVEEVQQDAARAEMAERAAKAAQEAEALAAKRVKERERRKRRKANEKAAKEARRLELEGAAAAAKSAQEAALENLRNKINLTMQNISNALEELKRIYSKPEQSKYFIIIMACIQQIYPEIVTSEDPAELGNIQKYFKSLFMELADSLLSIKRGIPLDFDIFIMGAYTSLINIVNDAVKTYPDNERIKSLEKILNQGMMSLLITIQLSKLKA